MKYSETIRVDVRRFFEDFECEVEYDMHNNSAQDRAEGLGATTLDEGSVTITNLNELWQEFVDDAVREDYAVEGTGIKAVVTLPEETTNTKRYPVEQVHFEDFEGYLIESLINRLSDNKW